MSETKKSITDWARDVHALATEKGWHDAPQSVGDMVANIHGEASELWEAYRSGSLTALCDKADKMWAAGIAPLTCLEEELADIVIRAMDSAGALGVDIEEAIRRKHEFNKTRSRRHGGKLA